MHKEEASRLFASLGDPTRVKITKMLYHNLMLDLQALEDRIGLSETELKLHLDALCEVGLLINQDNHYSCNKELITELLSFIPTKCGCCS